MLGSNRVLTQSLKIAARNASSKARNVVIVDGCRIPFTLGGTTYSDLLAVDLGRLALKGLLTKTAVDPKLIEYVCMGTVIQEPRTSNIARESGLGAGIPIGTPSHTVSQACISANQAITGAAEKIASGHADIAIAGGAETFSDVPIRYSKAIRQRLLKVSKVAKQGIPGYLSLLKGLKMKDFAPEAPAIANYTTGEVMGVSSERLSAKFGVSRREMDDYTVLSHTRAAKAHTDGLYADEIIPYKGSTTENGIKGDTSYDKVAKLSPAFIKNSVGTHTAANSSFLTDGASAVLIMTEEKALELGFKPKAYLRDWSYVANDPFDELLLGPTFATEQILRKNKLQLSDIGVIEFHEAFAGQVLSNMNAMESAKFAAERFPSGKPIGRFDMSITNTLGGSLSIGHPFGATGGRLVTTAANRLQRENKRFALIAACADGGLAAGCLLERYDNK